ncbi:hypothetical protein OG767_00295 [Micromonospora sp. NBC_01392]|uniref:hypothetical protein n=1 Tax=Micromonospora sp. NBC_01392 TaxID=2903588 RepID=UPI00324BB1B8
MGSVSGAWSSPLEAGDTNLIARLAQAPTPESAQLLEDAAQRRCRSDDEVAQTRAARNEIQRRAQVVAQLLEKVDGLPLTSDERSILQPPFGRASYLPSPDRPYAHLAVHTGRGGVSVTPLWASVMDANVVMSTVENRIKARATALDPLVALSVPAGIGSQLSYEIGGFVRQSPDLERELIRTLARVYSNPKVGEQADGNYTSWDRRERNERVRLEVLAFHVRNELGDEPVSRFAPYAETLPPRYGDAYVPASVAHDHFWGPDEDYTEDEPELREARDELAVIGMARHAGTGRYRAVSPTYGHLACFGHHGLLRCRQIGFDVLDVRGEDRIAFLVDKRDTGVFRKNPRAAVSIVKYRGGSVWLQSRGLVQLHDDAGLVREAIRRLESRYSRAHHRLALDLSTSEHTAGDYVLATLAHQRLSSRFREAERSSRVRR